MPETAEPIPFEIANEVKSIRTENANQVFDLSGLIQPEAEEELPFDLEKVYDTARK